ncbi:MAG: helix-turn-helix domain-containing protein [Terriglobia bacterium]
MLIIRHLMVRGLRAFREFQESGERISKNTLADCLQQLEARGIITAEAEKTDRRRVNYRLTEKGIDLAPVLLELLIWGARYGETGLPSAFVEKMARSREWVLAQARQRLQARDPTPLIPKSGHLTGGSNV